ncbi:pyridoxal phosphate-dependent aminotransferase family protein [Cellulophaga baltica]|uniref:aminotransferase class I/II-fold pyridoxal phosphate-dependent enzyme n=1 Tax=Cellulophaga TaxID=104264 RepID=UPI001C066DBB|nr:MULTISPECIES: pyridoxal phosphate-dependent aminotransferase family protein [Cellulophaga]MBU2995632.1 pyridoxal phosphate-dependent aminotransferase family protein [Cellulophaga baltica]MDO6767026.1 pyridoxal phosphate-dependent aminotransferase family protein [Cellulophaga sp. 1_MG-2023]
MPIFPKKLSRKLENRKQKNALRILPNSNNLIDFYSNDYIGFSKNKVIFENASQLLFANNFKQNGATGSRLISGNHNLYSQLENTIIDFHHVEAALVFNSGYDANIGFFSAVLQRGDLVFYDEYVHASIRDGIAMSNAKAYKFKHNEIEDLKQLVERLVVSTENEVYIVTESVFSMDGDSPNLKAFADFTTDNNFHFIVDEAHAIGVFGDKGQGLLHELGIQDQVFAQIVTFGKAMGCHGAAVLGSIQLKNYLVNFARSFIYTTGLSPHAVATIISAYQELLRQNKNREKLLENISFFKNQIEELNIASLFIKSEAAIQCSVISGIDNVKKLALKIEEKGYSVKPILSPTVPSGQERLRFCLHSYNSKEEIKNLLVTLNKNYNNG